MSGKLGARQSQEHSISHVEINTPSPVPSPVHVGTAENCSSHLAPSLLFLLSSCLVTPLITCKPEEKNLRHVSTVASQHP